jgi:hypothetical protein
MLSNKFRLNWPSGYREDLKKKSTNQKQELPSTAMLVNESDRYEQIL